MKLTTFEGAVTEFGGGLLVLGRHSEAEASTAEKAIDDALGGALSAAIERLRFKGKSRQRVTLDVAGGIAASRVLLLGLGDTDCDAMALRDFAALAVDEAIASRFETVGIWLPEAETHAQQIGAGVVLGAYRFDQLKSVDPENPKFEISAATLLAPAAAQAGLDIGAALGEAVNLARELVNEPANVCTPERLAQVARDLAEDPCFTVKVLGRDEIRAEGMGGIVAVSQGAAVPPRFIHLTYIPEGGTDENAICLVGKGLTFDSGGLSIKPAKGMEEMYIDMGGSAAVLGAMKAVSSLRPNVAVHMIVGSCENAVGADSYRPSDILTMYSGKTVEVLNTDAEGRLVLADCLHYAQNLKPRGIVDLATLTGACMIALGPYTTGAFSDDETWIGEVLAAGETAGEKLWRLPLDPKLADGLKSKRADITNLGPRWGGAITAAQFLQHFKGETPWVHLDIAGPAIADKNDGHIRVGATGVGVLTLWSLIDAAQA